MKAGFCSYAFRYAVEVGSLTPLGLVQTAGRMGAEAVQICDNLPLADLSQRDLDILVSTAAELAVDLEVGVSGLDQHTLQTYLRMATRLGSPILRALVRIGTGKPDPNRVLKVLETARGEIERSGVTLALENHFLLTPSELAHIVRRFDHPLVRVCLDPLNSIRLLAGPDGVLRELADLAVTAHIKDVQVKRNTTGFNVRGCPLGEGLLNGPAMINALKTRGQVRYVHLEAWMDPAENEQATLRQEEDWNLRGLETLKKLLATS